MLSRKAKKQVHPRILNSLAEQFTSTELLALGKFGTIVDVSAGRTLTSLGDQAPQTMLLLDGSVEVRRGNSIVVLNSGAFFGELDPAVCSPESGSSISLQDTAVLVFSRRDFDAALTVAPSLKSAIAAAQPCSDHVIYLTDRQPTNSVATHRLPSAA